MYWAKTERTLGGMEVEELGYGTFVALGPELGLGFFGAMSSVTLKVRDNSSTFRYWGAIRITIAMNVHALGRFWVVAEVGGLVFASNDALVSAAFDEGFPLSWEVLDIATEWVAACISGETSVGTISCSDSTEGSDWRE
jgi:hypothetical protein